MHEILEVWVSSSAAFLNTYMCSTESVVWKFLELLRWNFLLLNICLFLLAYVSISAFRGQKKLSLPLKLELEVVGSYGYWESNLSS